MFGLFNNKTLDIDPELILFFDENWKWIKETFGIEHILDHVYLPNQEDFPIVFNGSINSLEQVLEIILPVMGISRNEFDLNIFDSGMQTIGENDGTIILQNEEKLPGGTYHEEEDIKVINISKTIANNPIAVVATLVHELCHLVLLGHLKMEENDEFLTEMMTVYFGFGVISSSASFQYDSSIFGWSYNSSGYLTQREWAYVLALYAIDREDENADWTKSLNKSVLYHFKKSIKYIKNR